jgi:hypothetical protein
MSDKIDVTPAILDLVLYAGDGTDFEVDFQDEDEQVLDVSGLTWTAQIRKTRSAEIANDLVIDTTSAATGVLIVKISSEITRQLPKSAQWDLQSVADGGEPRTVLQGTVTCNQDVTRVDEVTP